jgi:hypothetical protein
MNTQHLQLGNTTNQLQMKVFRMENPYGTN